MTGKLVWLFVFCFCLIVSFSHAYTIILNNGKKVEGTLVSETPDMYILKDAGGIQLNLKKSLVDIQKTTSSNQAAPAATANPASKPETKPEPIAAKKPARTITMEDLEKLREKYDLGGGTFSEANKSQGSEKTEKKDANKKELSPEELRGRGAEIRGQIKQAEASYDELKRGCDFAQGLTTQSGTATNDKGQRLDLGETRKKVCDAADRAKIEVDVSHQQYQELLDSAKSQGVTQDWLENH